MSEPAPDQQPFGGLETGGDPVCNCGHEVEEHNNVDRRCLAGECRCRGYERLFPPRVTISEGLTVERLGNLIELQVTGHDETERRRLLSQGIAHGTWGSEPPTRTVHRTLSVDDAMDLRDKLNAWFADLGSE